MLRKKWTVTRAMHDGFNSLKQRDTDTHIKETRHFTILDLSKIDQTPGVHYTKTIFVTVMKLCIIRRVIKRINIMLEYKERNSTSDARSKLQHATPK